MRSRLLIVVLFLLVVVLVYALQRGDEGRAGRSERRVIVTDKAPAAVGPYSQGILVGNTLYCAGQIALDPESGKLVSGGIREQTQRVLQNLGAVLAAAGMNYDDVVRTTVYLADISDYKEMNEAYAAFFPNIRPTRATVQAGKLPAGALLEISCIAVKTD